MALSVSIEHPCVTLLFQNTRSIRTAGYCCCDVLHPMLDTTQGVPPARSGLRRVDAPYSAL